ncbi:MAG: hypothetical protein IT536_20015 [Hyphomicrobiales bacterium]|nr:hypothetical protein [Hyphomicrobiales bacterium]
MLPQTFNDPHRVMHDDRSLFWVRPLEVDADGAPNAYHRDDPHGRRGLAIEYIGNGMTIYRDGKPMPFQLNEKDNSEWLSVYRKIVANGWRAPPGYSVDIYGFARDQSGAICMSESGRLISATSLTFEHHQNRCSQRRYVDARKFPGIVVPNRAANERSIENRDPEVAPPFAERGVTRGDLAVVYNPATGVWKGALLYDTGPRHLLGEGSLRLVMNLRGQRQVPTTAIHLNSLGIVETFSLTFPGSVADLGPSTTWTPETVEQKAGERFKAWGGGSFTAALQRLFQCARDYKSVQARLSDP